MLTITALLLSRFSETRASPYFQPRSCARPSKDRSFLIVSGFFFRLVRFAFVIWRGNVALPPARSLSRRLPPPLALSTSSFCHPLSSPHPVTFFLLVFIRRRCVEPYTEKSKESFHNHILYSPIVSLFAPPKSASPPPKEKTTPCLAVHTSTCPVVCKSRPRARAKNKKKSGHLPTKRRTARPSPPVLP